jgi:hypothetical protein
MSSEPLRDCRILLSHIPREEFGRVISKGLATCVLGWPLPALCQRLDHEGNGDEGAERGADVGEHHYEKNPGDFVPPESLH